MINKTKERNIVVINQDSGYLMIDVINSLVTGNADVSLIAGRIVERDKPLPESVRVRKIVRYNRSNRLKRLISWAIAFLQIVFIVRTKFRSSYLLIVSNPPLNTFLPFLCSNRYSFLIFDVYPDALEQVGLVRRSSFVVRLWAKANRKVFARADNIFTLTEKMSEALEEYTGKGKISVVPVWSDNAFFKPVPKRLNHFIDEHHLHGRFVVLYSGNLGATHNIEILPDIAARVASPDVLFLIIGNGDKRKWLINECSARRITNMRFLPLQSTDTLPFSFAAADLAIVSQGTIVSGLSIPSKTFNFMSAGLPLLCITGEGSELSLLVEKYDNGRCFSPDQVKAIAGFIDEISENGEMQENFGRNSLIASHDFNPQNAETIAEAVIRSMNK